MKYILSLFFLALIAPVSAHAYFPPTEQSENYLLIANVTTIFLVLFFSFLILKKVAKLTKFSSALITFLGLLFKIFILFGLSQFQFFSLFAYVLVVLPFFILVDIFLIKLDKRNTSASTLTLASLLLNGTLLGAVLATYVADILLYESTGK